MTPLAATLVKQAPPEEAVTAPPVTTEPEATKPTPPVMAPPSAKRLDRRLALWLGIGCPLITAVNIAIEPLPADPNAPVPVGASLLFLVFTASVVATAVYAARRDALTLPYATVAGVLAVVLTVTCPMSGHHAGVGWWWYTQMTLSIGFLALSAVAWRRHAGRASTR